MRVSPTPVLQQMIHSPTTRVAVVVIAEFVFLEVQPLSALFWLLLVGTVGVAVVSYPQLHRGKTICKCQMFPP